MSDSLGIVSAAEGLRAQPTNWVEDVLADLKECINLVGEAKAEPNPRGEVFAIMQENVVPGRAENLNLERGV